VTLASEEARYARDLESGLRFEDFVTDVFYDHGLPIVGWSSRRYQSRGENRAGVEIKFDRNYARTRNLFIETAECPTTAHPMKPAGIYDERNWLFVIGDYSTLYVFARTQLVRLHQRVTKAAGKKLVAPGTPWNGIRCTSIPTAEGMLLPEAAARDLAARVLTPRVRAWDPSTGEVAPHEEPT
jgi:hypothetical protein